MSRTGTGLRGAVSDGHFLQNLSFQIWAETLKLQRLQVTRGWAPRSSWALRTSEPIPTCVKVRSSPSWRGSGWTPWCSPCCSSSGRTGRRDWRPTGRRTAATPARTAGSRAAGPAGRCGTCCWAPAGEPGQQLSHAGSEGPLDRQSQKTQTRTARTFSRSPCLRVFPRYWPTSSNTNMDQFWFWGPDSPSCVSLKVFRLSETSLLHFFLFHSLLRGWNLLRWTRENSRVHHERRNPSLTSEPSYEHFLHKLCFKIKALVFFDRFQGNIW